MIEKFRTLLITNPAEREIADSYDFYFLYENGIILSAGFIKSSDILQRENDFKTDKWIKL